MRAKVLETDVAERAAWFLERVGFDVYPEVQTVLGRADLVGVTDTLVVVIECKVQNSFAVLDQARRWKGRANAVYVATWDPTRIFADTAVHFGLGVLPTRFFVDPRHWERYGPNWWGHGFRAAPLTRRAASDAVRSCLHEDQKRFTAGTAHGYSTPFRRSMDAALQFIQEHPGCSLGELIAGINHHYASDASARRNLSMWLQREGCEMRRDGKKSVLYPPTPSRS